SASHAHATDPHINHDGMNISTQILDMQDTSLETNLAFAEEFLAHAAALPTHVVIPVLEYPSQVWPINDASAG
ncbi:hypothetical protein V491_08472, partial [Pseudogymnoascus sp. VKM F-3775]